MTLNNYEKSFLRIKYLETRANLQETRNMFFRKYGYYIPLTPLLRVWRCADFNLDFPRRPEAKGSLKKISAISPERFSTGNGKISTKGNRTSE